MPDSALDRAPLRRLFRYASRYRPRILLATACSILKKLFDLAPPLLIGTAVDIVVNREHSLLAQLGVASLETQLVVLSVATVVIWVLESLFEYAQAVLWRTLAQTLQHDLRLDAYEHVQSLELGYFEDQSTGGLLSVLNDDINQLERFLDGGADDLVEVGTAVLLIGALFFGVSPAVAWLAFLPVPLVLWGSFRFQRRIAPRYAAVREQVGVLNGLLSNNLSGIATIKSFTAEPRELQRVDAESQRYLALNSRAIRLSSAFSPLIRMAIVVGFTATLAYGGLLTLRGDIGVGPYSVLIFMTQRLLWPLTRLGQTFDLYQRAMASTHRILDLLAVSNDVADGSRDLASSDVRGALYFDNVSFAYKNDVPVLAGLTLDAPAGETIAIVGSTGAGKTSVIKLLLRFYDVRGGAVTLDGRDLRELTKASVRRSIGLVSQDVFLFHGTVRENIAYGSDREVSDEAIVAAARVAEAHDFITAFPDGYETLVGERGQKLSGGQRQRLSIARAVLKDPPILVLDEATSSVDNETEAAIQRSLERIAVGRTTLVIAHRLSTVRHADRIYVLERGCVAEQGTHEALLEHDGVYAKLWNVQTGEQAHPEAVLAEALASQPPTRH